MGGGLVPPGQFEFTAARRAAAHEYGVIPLRQQRPHRCNALPTDEADTPVELAVSYFDPAHYSYRVRLRRGPS